MKTSNALRPENFLTREAPLLFVLTNCEYFQWRGRGEESSPSKFWAVGKLAYGKFFSLSENFCPKNAQFTAENQHKIDLNVGSKLKFLAPVISSVELPVPPIFLAHDDAPSYCVTFHSPRVGYVILSCQNFKYSL